MFKWGRTSNKTSSYEPKTPKLASVSLPDERYTPIAIHSSYMEKPRRNSFLRRFTQDNRAMTPMLDAWKPHQDVSSARSRVRTVSTPVRDVEAPRPIRPHPSQGGFMPVMEHTDRIRSDLSRGPLVPVGVPSAAFLEDQIRRSRAELQTAQPPRLPIDMPVTHPDYEYPEEKRIREVAKRTGAKVSRQISKAYLDEQLEQQKQAESLRALSTSQTKKRHSKSWVGDLDEKSLVDFEDWKAVPIDMMPAKSTTTEIDPKAPLKPALKKTSSLKPTHKPALKSALKKESAYYSEGESQRRKDDRMKPPRVIQTPSKAFLEEQQEKLEQMHGRGWSSHHHPSQARPMHEIRPSAFIHTNSSSTGSPTDSMLAAHDPRVRSRRSSFVEPPPVMSSSNYMPAYIKEDLLRSSYAHLNRGPGEAPPTHGLLSWPLVEYAVRKREPYPLIYFDAGFDPRDKRYPVKAKRELHYSPLTREEMDLPVCYGIHVSEIVIVNRKLQQWPIHIRTGHGSQFLRVIDIFRAIYDTYAVPLTPQELMQCGDEYIERCQRAFKQRCEDSSQFTHIEERRGLLRIDILRGRRIFKGIVPLSGRPFHYELVFDEGR